MRKRWPFLCVLTAAATGAVFACGTPIPTEATTPAKDGGPGPTPSSPLDAGSNPTGSDGAAEDVFDAGKPADHGGNGTEGPCTTGALPGTTEVFVTMNAAADAACGGVDHPCTLADAIAKRPSVINVGPGTYKGNFTVANLKGLRIVGGWSVTGTTWTRACMEKTVTIGADTASQAVFVTDASVTFAYVDIVSKAAATDGESVNGLVVTNGSRVTLDHVNVIAAAAMNGTAGTDGGPLSPPACTMSGDGANGADASGQVGGPGTLTFGTGGVSSQPGGPGGSGAPGHNGTAAPAAGSDSGALCFPSGGTACVSGLCTRMRDPGKNGCGGVGGTGGNPGTNGGSSIAMYVTGASSVNVVAGSMTSGPAGNGGAGGKGGAKGPGTPGTAGGAVESPDCFTSVSDDFCGNMADVSANCAILDSSQLTPLLGPGGKAGGPGGSGGGGGPGGGGSGGFSYGVWSDSLSVVDLDATTTLAHGTAGAAGAPNGSPGAAGNSNK